MSNIRLINRGRAAGARGLPGKRPEAFPLQRRDRSVTSGDFSAEIIAMEQTLYHVAASQLRDPADREDAVQEALRRGWEKRDRLREPQFLRTWMVRILLNCCHDIQRRASRCQPTDALPEAAAEEAPAIGLRDALLALDERLRMPIVLHCIDGYPIEDVARMLRIPQGTVKSRLSRGKARLSELLMEEVRLNDH